MKGEEDFAKDPILETLPEDIADSANVETISYIEIVRLSTRPFLQLFSWVSFENRPIEPGA